eukprot:scaffold267502_cov30-Tisochrysis_lutea.AAC.3
MSWRVSEWYPSGVTWHPPSGSPSAASKPAATSTRSAANSLAIGMRISDHTASYSASPGREEGPRCLHRRCGRGAAREEGAVLIAVNREVEDGWVSLEDALDACAPMLAVRRWPSVGKGTCERGKPCAAKHTVSVVDVPVDDEDTPSAQVRARMRRGHGHRVEHTEPHCAMRLWMQRLRMSQTHRRHSEHARTRNADFIRMTTPQIMLH